MSQQFRSCHKEAFDTWTAALRVVKRMQRVERIQGRTIHNQAPYKCPECNGIHLTSHSYNIKKKRAA